MGNVADEATIIRAWLTNELAQLLNGSGPARMTETTGAAILAELRLANRRWFGIDGAGVTFANSLAETLLELVGGGSPTDQPPVAGWDVWLDTLRTGALWQDGARTVAAEIGDPVASWYDSSSGVSAFQDTEAARPLRAAEGLQFAPSKRLICNLGSRGLPETTYAVFRLQGGELETQIVVDSGSQQYAGMIYAAPNQPFLSAFAGARVTNSAAALGSRVAAAVVFNGDSSVVQVNNASVSGDVGAVNLGTGLSIGGGAGGDGTSNKTIACVLRYPAAHSALERDEVIDWLVARHGITI